MLSKMRGIGYLLMKGGDLDEAINCQTASLIR